MASNVSRTSCRTFSTLWMALIDPSAPLRLALSFDLRLTNVCLDTDLRDSSMGSRTAISLLVHGSSSASADVAERPGVFAVLTPGVKEQAKIDVLLCQGKVYDLSCSGQNGITIIGYRVSSSVPTNAINNSPYRLPIVKETTSGSDWETESGGTYGVQGQSVKRHSESQYPLDTSLETTPRPVKRPRKNRIESEPSVGPTESLDPGDSYRRATPLGSRASTAGVEVQASPTYAAQTSSGGRIRTSITEHGVAAASPLARLGMVMFVYYVLYVNGTPTRSETQTPLRITVGNNGIIPGIDEAFVGMRVGETRRIYMPPELIRSSLRLNAEDIVVLDVQVLDMAEH
ncbi:hypothetical protein BD626DRAFT_503116 [Schizophyllum amplum]|uniref:peptidylprolyl isomerase n=1 Tax=Schizophyllum amplum TaxID=97359 RepID=A0A550C7W7_9AGAR|nr:hypothetical protein BD626DRAFT_503116 [Auriculariopsis ampla]